VIVDGTVRDAKQFSVEAACIPRGLREWMHKDGPGEVEHYRRAEE